MGLGRKIREFITELYPEKPVRPCDVCSAHMVHIASLEEQVRHLRYQAENAETALLKAVRIVPLIENGPRVAHEPVATGQQPWSSIRRNLELKHRKPKPEDKTEEYWKAKNAEVAAEAEVLLRKQQAPEAVRPEPLSDYQADMEDLKDAS